MPDSTFLDWFGYRVPPSNYFHWDVSIPVLKSRIYDNDLKGVDHTFIGWGANWKDISRCFDRKYVSVHKITPDEYRRIVDSFRATDQYKSWDLKLIKGTDHPVSWYVGAYENWLEECLKYFFQTDKPNTMIVSFPFRNFLNKGGKTPGEVES